MLFSIFAFVTDACVKKVMFFLDYLFLGLSRVT